MDIKGIIRKPLACPCPDKHDLFHSEEGFSTAGMVVALLLTLSLLFTAAQVYQINSTSADIQSVADMAALAAENEIAEYYLIAQLCDAVILSLSLTGIITLGVGLAALCVPPIAALGDTLINMGEKILKARDNFADKASEGLNSIQRILPYLCAASAAGVVAESSGGQMKATYHGLAIALPFDGEEIEIGPLEGLEDTVSSIDKEKGALKDAAEKAEEAARAANEYKKIGFSHDCGENPNYCMYERASHLAELSSDDNPLYQSVDTWNFSVALKRAQSYYPIRLGAENIGTDATPKEKAQSALRKRFYTYAADETKKGYVHEEGDEFDAYFPRLPKNTNEMKQTVLFTEAVYPVSTQGKDQVMHAFDQCPGISGLIMGRGSAAECEQQNMPTCTICEFSVGNLGKVAAASTSIDNGFEYHYNKVADAAEAYKQARKTYAPEAAKVKGIADELFKSLQTLAEQAVSKRIEVKPPGRFGSVAFVISNGRSYVSDRILTSFVQGSHSLGTRGAISAATLVKGSEEEGSTIISSFLDGFSSRFDGVFVQGSSQILGAWSALLHAYSCGQNGIQDSLEKAFEGIPLVSESGLGTWAADAFSAFMKSVGLEPADLRARRPALVNSIHVASVDNSSIAKSIVSAKEGYASSSDLFSGVLSSLSGQVFEQVDWKEGKITIASIELFGEGGPSIPITLTLPTFIKDNAGSFVEGMLGYLSGFYEVIVGGRRWN